jgi:hypothetical protein
MLCRPSNSEFSSLAVKLMPFHHPAQDSTYAGNKKDSLGMRQQGIETAKQKTKYGKRKKRTKNLRVQSTFPRSGKPSTVIV